MLNIGTQLQGCGCMTVDKQIIRLHSPTNLHVTNFANSTIQSNSRRLWINLKKRNLKTNHNKLHLLSKLRLAFSLARMKLKEPKYNHVPIN